MAAESIKGLQICRSLCAGGSDTDSDVIVVNNADFEAGILFLAVMSGYEYCSSIPR